MLRLLWDISLSILYMHIALHYEWAIFHSTFIIYTKYVYGPEKSRLCHKRQKKNKRCQSWHYSCRRVSTMKPNSIEVYKHTKKRRVNNKKNMSSFCFASMTSDAGFQILWVWRNCKGQDSRVDIVKTHNVEVYNTFIYLFLFFEMSYLPSLT